MLIKCGLDRGELLGGRQYFGGGNGPAIVRAKLRVPVLQKLF